MATKRKGSLIAIQVGLGVVIVILAYFLYDSITSPWEAVEREQRLTDQTRERMSQVRTALRRYEEVNDRFPGSLDSLAVFATSDSLLTLNPDSIFGESFSPDLFLRSARSGSTFVYAVNDTGRVNIYLLKDPDSEDYIGSSQPDITALHAASWE
jgi:hypothetical protein